MTITQTTMYLLFLLLNKTLNPDQDLRRYCELPVSKHWLFFLPNILDDNTGHFVPYICYCFPTLILVKIFVKMEVALYYKLLLCSKIFIVEILANNTCSRVSYIWVVFKDIFWWQYRHTPPASCLQLHCYDVMTNVLCTAWKQVFENTN